MQVDEKGRRRACCAFKLCQLLVQKREEAETLGQFKALRQRQARGSKGEDGPPGSEGRAEPSFQLSLSCIFSRAQSDVFEGCGRDPDHGGERLLTASSRTTGKC